MAQGKPTILIIHGAWHHPAYFEGVVNLLNRQSYEVSCPRLPTCSDDVPPTKSLEDDVKLIREAAAALADEGKEMVVLMHSYGGVVGTDALHGLSIFARAKSGLKGGIRRLLYMCAFIPKKGESLAGIFGGNLPPWLELGTDKRIHIQDPEGHFYNDISPEQSKKATAMLTGHPISAQFTPVSHEAWREAPVSYLLCEKDQGIPVEFVQKMMCGRIEALGVKVDYHTCSGSHSPFLSMPETVVEVVMKVAEM